MRYLLEGDLLEIRAYFNVDTESYGAGSIFSFNQSFNQSFPLNVIQWLKPKLAASTQILWLKPNSTAETQI